MSSQKEYLLCNMAKYYELVNEKGIQNNIAYQQQTLIVSSSRREINPYLVTFSTKSALNNVVLDTGSSFDSFQAKNTNPNRQQMKLTHQGHLPIPYLLKEATEAHIVQILYQYSLISIKKMCDAGSSLHFRQVNASFIMKVKLSFVALELIIILYDN